MPDTPGSDNVATSLYVMWHRGELLASTFNVTVRADYSGDVKSDVFFLTMNVFTGRRLFSPTQQQGQPPL